MFFRCADRVRIVFDKQMANSWTAAKFQETKMKKNAFKPNVVKQIKSNEIKMAR